MRNCHRVKTKKKNSQLKISGCWLCMKLKIMTQYDIQVHNDNTYMKRFLAVGTPTVYEAENSDTE